MSNFARITTLAALVSIAACHRGGSVEPATVAGPRVNDGNIIAIVLAANNTDLSYARLAGRTQNADVRSFAQLMTTDHTILNMRVNDIAQRNRIRPEDNDISLSFRDYSAERRDVMRGLPGAAFDSTYAANEVQYHLDLLSALNQVLAPQAKNAELREFVTNLKPAVTAHLAHAEQLQANLKKKK
jgi:putative membrane protein